MQQLLIRADAGTQMGTGHIMRCLALAQAWQEAGGTVAFASAALPPALAGRLASEGAALFTVAAQPGGPDDTRLTIDLARTVGASWVMVDGYQFGADYQIRLKEAGLRVLFVDDYGHAGAYCADLVLNQNSYAHERWYADRSPHSRLLLGPRYALLRREFWPWRGWRREAPEVARTILITMGGSDPDNVTLNLLQALDQLTTPGLEATLVIGGGNPHHEQLQAAAARARHTTRIARNVSDMPALMAWADIAVSAGGTTCYELAFMGVPTLIIALAENQVAITESLAVLRVGRNLGWHSQLEMSGLARACAALLGDDRERVAMSERGRALIDGYGSARVTSELLGRPLRLRRAVDEDRGLLWEWSNEPGARAASFSGEPIPWERHVAWFAAHIDSSEHRIFLALDAGGLPVGQVRFDFEGDTAVISVSLDQRARGLGYGSRLIELGAASIFAEGRAARIDAYVKPENQASLRAFERAGFVHLGRTTMRGNEALRLVLYREESSL